jgi:hypothetical protein
MSLSWPCWVLGDTAREVDQKQGLKKEVTRRAVQAGAPEQRCRSEIITLRNSVPLASHGVEGQ